MSLEEMQEQIERYYINMENELLMNIAKKLEMGKPMEIDKFDTEKGEKLVGSGGVNEWQLERLKELGGLTEENAEIIAKYSNKTIEDVNAIFDRAREIGTEIDKEILGLGIKAGILNEINPVVEDVVVRKILNNSIKEVLTTFNKQNNSLLASAGKEYKDIVNNVSSQVMSGTKTTIKAMQEAVTNLAEKGLTGFTAKNGAQWSPEAYTKMVIRSNTQNTINHIQDERMQLAGNDYIEVSSHIGARPLCSQDQGKIFSLSGNTTPIQDGSGLEIIPKPWSSSTYGEPAGIFGINCGHSRYAFVPGLSYKREMDFTKKENDDAYIEKQQQRLYERTIRNKKREIAMLKEIGAEDDYISIKTNKLKSYQEEYFSFLDKTGRTRIRGNEWIGTTDLSASQKAKVKKSLNNWQNTKTKIKHTKLTNDEVYAINKYIGFESYTYNEKLRNGIKLTETENQILNNLDKALEKMPKYKGEVTRSISILSEDIDIFLKDYQVGSIVLHKAYTSTTKGDIYNPESKVQMLIKSKKGRDISEYNEQEQEVLFTRNSKFKVLKVDTKDDFYVRIELEEVE